MSMHRRLTSLLRQHFHPVEGTAPHDLWDFLHQFGDQMSALLCAPLFCPEFIEGDGSILLNRMGPNIEERFLGAKGTSKLSLAEIESSFNFLEVSYAFADRSRSSNGEGTLLAEFIAESWRARLMY